MPTRTKTLIYVIIMGLLALTPLQLRASGQPEFYRRYVSVPTEQLYQMGEKLLNNGQHADSALICMTIIGNRYTDEMDKNEKLICAKAFLFQWRIYFFFYYDFNKQYESLIKAKNIFDELKTDETELYLDFGVVYQTLFDQINDRKMGLNALTYYKKAYAASTKKHDADTYEPTFTNMITTAIRLGNLQSIANEWASYRRLPANKHYALHPYNLMFYRAMACYQAKRFEEAYKFTMQQLNTVPNNEQYARFRYIALANLADIRACQQRYDEAVGFMNQAWEQAKQGDMPDGKLEVYRNLSDYYQHLGDERMSNHYLRMYSELKDSIMSDNMLSKAKDFRFLNEMTKAEKQLDEMEQKQRVSHILMGSGTIVLAIVLIFLYVVWKKNRQLHDSNHELYLKNKELLSQKTTARKRKAAVSNDEKNNVVEAIENAMEKTEQICSVDFSADRLADMTGIAYHTLSKVINEHYHCNFNMLLNQFRIHEACRKIDADESHKLTIETLSGLVGFRSRTTFTTAFKLYTGLTPSQYMKMGREKNAAQPFEG